MNAGAEPARRAVITDRRGRDRIVAFDVIGDVAVAEGDIVLGRVDELRRVTNRQGRPDAPTPPARHTHDAHAALVEMPMGFIMSDPAKLWPRIVSPGAIQQMVPLVPYEIDPDLPRPDRVLEAMRQWTFRTAIEFQPLSNQSDWVYYTRDFEKEGGRSAIGMVGGRQNIWLADDSGAGVVMHEIGHAVGLWHEHSRSDRDRYVTIHKENVIGGKADAFSQHITDDADEIGPYDYDSIMHYSRKAFSRNGADTITPTDPSAAIGNRRDLSDGDINAVRHLYPRELIHNPTPSDRVVDEQHPHNPP